MNKETEEIDNIIDNFDNILNKFKSIGQGRVFIVGTKITYKNKFGIITDLNKGSQDPIGSTIDLRLDDGTMFTNIKVSSPSLELFRQ